MTLTEMIAAYAALTAAHRYNLGFVLAGRVYSIFLTWEEIAAYFTLDHASSVRGGYAKIRIRLHKADRLALIAKGAEMIGAAADLAAMAKFNQGDNYERIVLEHYTGGTWSKNSDPFWVAGDITLEGEQVQVKFDGAELTNEKTLRRALAAG